MSRIFVAESPAAYARRPALVVDSSILAAAIFGEPELEHAVASMRGRALCAPSLIDYELANVAWNKVRRGVIVESAAVEAFEELATLELTRHPIVTREVFALALRYQVTAYDAAYLWLAGHLKAPLATLDSVLGTAAQKYLSSAS